MTQRPASLHRSIHRSRLHCMRGENVTELSHGWQPCPCCLYGIGHPAKRDERGTVIMQRCLCWLVGASMHYDVLCWGVARWWWGHAWPWQCPVTDHIAVSDRGPLIGDPIELDRLHRNRSGFFSTARICAAHCGDAGA